MCVRERDRKKRDERYRWKRVGRGGASRSSDLVLSLACVASRRTGCDRSRGWRHTNNEPRRDSWKAPGSEVSTFLFEKKEEKKVSSLRFQSTSSKPLVPVHTGLTRTRFYVYNTNYIRDKFYTHKRLHTYTHTEQKKRNTILYSQSAFCLQFHFNLLFVNLPSARESLTYMRAKKRLKEKQRETTSTPLLLICKSTEK